MASPYIYETMLAVGGLSDKTVQSVSQAAFIEGGKAEIHYSIPPDSHEGARAWLIENRLTISDLLGLSGTWRTSVIETRELRDRSGNLQGSELVQVMEKGYYTNWNWEAVRTVAGSGAIGKVVTISGLSAYASPLFRESVSFVLPFVEPTRVQAIVESLTDTSYTDLVVGGKEYDGIWFNGGATHRQTQTGTCEITFTLCKPQYIATNYQDANTWERVDTYSLLKVPVVNAAAIMEAWKTLDGLPAGAIRKGASASQGGIDPSDNTTTITLSISTHDATLGEDQSRTVQLDAFAKTTSITEVSQTTPIAEPTVFDVGSPVTVKNEKSKDGKYTTTETEEVMKSGETAEHAIQINHAGETTKRHTAEHLDPASLPAWSAVPVAHPAAGTAIQITRSLNKGNGVKVDRVEKVAVVTTISESSYTDRNGTTYHQVVFNVLPANVSAAITTFGHTATHNVSVSHQFNEDTGTFTLSMTASPPSIGNAAYESYGNWESSGVEYENGVAVAYNYGYITAGAFNTVDSYINGKGNIRYGKLSSYGWWGSYKTKVP